jgi:hypothetical protein
LVIENLGQECNILSLQAVAVVAHNQPMETLAVLAVVLAVFVQQQQQLVVAVL